MKYIKILCTLLLAACLHTVAFAQKEFVQRILLDKPVTAGPLKVFPVLEDPNTYYYLPNKVRLGTDDQGRPQFSFIHFVENVSSGAAEDVNNVANGGGYVHLMVGLIVTPDEIKEAEQELRKTNPRGKLVGPVIYRGGTMALINKSVITNAANPEGASRVLGIGPAPVLEGDKIAVSFLLNKDDAVILKESLKSATPDISFNLSMTLAGYQSPVEFKIEMDWEKIYNHDIFNAGVATPILQAEIGIATQELKESGAIKVTQIGEDPNLQKLQELLTNKLIDMAFVPFGREGSPNWNDLAQPLNGGQSFLDRATTQLNNERQRQRENNNRIADRNQNERRYADEENRRRREEEARRNAQNGGGGSGNNGSGSAGGTGASGSTGGSAERLAEETSEGDEGASATVREGRPSPRSESAPARTGTAFSNPANFRNGAQGIPDYQPVQDQQESLQSINAVASYQKKTVKHTGKYTAEAKTYFTTSLTETFGGNIGKINCKDCIREVNLASPLYTQREIVAFVDGEISQDFDKFINYVTVSMKKTHPGGDITTKEVRVDRKNFNAEGNRFKLLYGWMPGDNDRKTWLNYEYKTTWNFFGGATVESDWTKSANPVIPLKAPVKRKTINIIADPDEIKDKGVRSITVRVYYKVAGGEEQFKQTSLNIGKQVLNAAIDFILPREISEYEYEVDWLLKDNQVKKSGRKKTAFDDIYVDVLPN